jgi:HSP20 family protein
MNSVLNDMATSAPMHLSMLNESETGFGPAVEMYETETEVVVRAELPGVTKDDIEVHAEKNAVSIRGENRDKKEVDEDGYYRREIRYGAFSRTLPTPVDIVPDQVAAKFADGVLTVRAKKAEEASTGTKVDVE